MAIIGGVRESPPTTNPSRPSTTRLTAAGCARIFGGEDQAHHPERSDQIAYREAKESAGRRRPPAFDARLYCHRSTVERGFNRLKQWRGIANRYDKYALIYLGGATQSTVPSGDAAMTDALVKRVEDGVSTRSIVTSW